MLVKELCHHFYTVFAVFLDKFPHKTHFFTFFIKQPSFATCDRSARKTKLARRASLTSLVQSTNFTAKQLRFHFCY